MQGEQRQDRSGTGGLIFGLVQPFPQRVLHDVVRLANLAQAKLTALDPLQVH